MKRNVFICSFLLISGWLQAKTFYFPHYGDGGGISMVFSITNLAPVTAKGTLTFPLGTFAALVWGEGCPFGACRVEHARF